jgi:uncharacterized repeat protein (TIGR03803 family)
MCNLARAVSHQIALLIVCMLLFPFSITSRVQARTFTLLHSFTGGNDGANPFASLIRDKAGNLYGTTLNGGERNAGTVFELDSTGTITILYSFTGQQGDGRHPSAGLVRDNSGNLWSTLRDGVGHSVSLGFVYKISPAGKETKPHVFKGPTSDGSNPQAGLICDPVGTFYGTTAGGGANFAGTVFKLHAGEETVLYSFTGTNGDGAYPEASLVRDLAGNLYGTTMSGGDSTFGTVFKLDTSGHEVVLHSFDGTDGAQLAAGLILDGGGNLYGTTISGTTARGTVFKLDTAGKNFSTLYFFSGGGDGSNPLGPVVMDKKGNLYGTTQFGGDLSCGSNHQGCGVVFKLNPAGKETVLHRFSGSDGQVPSSGLIRDAAGNLYGTAPRGGGQCSGSGCGVIFKIKP